MGDCAPVDSWFRIVLNLTSGALIGYWWLKARQVRRDARECAEMRALVQRNLHQAIVLLEKIEAFPGDDGDPIPPPLH